MDNKVTYRLARGLEETGGLVLRYNFRGAGRSKGKHDDGRGEQDDLKAALRFLKAEGGAGLPTLLAGFSFGSYMSLLVALQDPEIDALLLVGVPALTYDLSMLSEVDRPLGLIQGEFDEHGPLEDLGRVWRGVPEPKVLRVVAGAGHFFDDEQVELMEAVRDLAAGPVLGPVLARP
jgi:alpha/beta superfamily hydrolase